MHARKRVAVPLQMVVLSLEVVECEPGVTAWGAAEHPAAVPF